MTLEDKVQLIKNNYLFSTLAEDNLVQIALKTTEKDYHQGEVLIEQDSLDTIIYFINSGAVQIYRMADSGEKILLTKRGPGEIIGELSLFNQYRRAASAEALMDTQVLGLSAADFLQTLYAFPEISISLLQVLAHRIDELGKMVEKYEASGV